MIKDYSKENDNYNILYCRLRNLNRENRELTPRDDGLGRELGRALDNPYAETRGRYENVIKPKQ